MFQKSCLKTCRMPVRKGWTTRGWHPLEDVREKKSQVAGEHLSEAYRPVACDDISSNAKLAETENKNADLHEDHETEEC